MFNDRYNRKILRIFFILLLATVTFFFIFASENPDSKAKEITDILRDKSQWISDFADEIMGDSTSVPVTNIENPAASVHFIDVGQGDATLIRTGEGDILIDGGETAEGTSLVHYLKKVGVTRLELVVATHPHSDHIGGLTQVIEEIEVGQVLLPEIPDKLIPTTRSFSDMLKAIDSTNTSLFIIEDNSIYDFGETQLIFMTALEKPEDLNNLSAVVKMTVGDISFMFTGDCEKIAEQSLVDSGRDITADVLSIGHHGSNTSTSKAFLKTVNPSIGVISCGIDNSYGHPHREVVERLKKAEVKIYRTDRSGTVIVETDGKDLAVITETGEEE